MAALSPSTRCAGYDWCAHNLPAIEQPVAVWVIQPDTLQPNLVTPLFLLLGSATAAASAVHAFRASVPHGFRHRSACCCGSTPDARENKCGSSANAQITLDDISLANLHDFAHVSFVVMSASCLRISPRNVGTVVPLYATLLMFSESVAKSLRRLCASHARLSVRAKPMRQRAFLRPNDRRLTGIHLTWHQ